MGAGAGGLGAGAGGAGAGESGTGAGVGAGAGAGDGEGDGGAGAGGGDGAQLVTTRSRLKTDIINADISFRLLKELSSPSLCIFLTILYFATSGHQL